MGDAGTMIVPTHHAPPSFCFESGQALVFPTVDIVTFALEHLNDVEPNQVIYADAQDPSRCILAGQVTSIIKRLTATLKRNGLEAGDCVCIHSYNSIWYPLIWLAIISAGGVVTGSNPAYTSTELVHHFRITKSKFVVAQNSCLAAVKEAVLECDASTGHIIILGADDFIHDDSACLFNHAISLHVGFDDVEVQETSVAVYAATSGTTGLPKAAELSHKYLVTQARQLEEAFTRRNNEVRQLICLPVFHAFAAQLSIVLPLRLGMTTYFMPRFNLPDYLRHVDQFQITDSAVVPPVISALLTAPSEALQSLRYIICAGAPITAAVQTKLYSNLNPSATIAQCWGATELGWVSVFSHLERDRHGSVGRLLPNTQLKIIDDNGNLVTTDNSPGEARIKSPSMFTRYRDNPTANASAFDEEGFYCTGDRVYIENGKIYICGRMKDILKVNGWQVSPEEIEHVISGIDAVSDCAVIGHTVFNAMGLEETKPRAYVVKKAFSTVTAEYIVKHVSDNLVGYKRLSGGVVFVNEIPRSNTGKILRRILSRMDAADVFHNTITIDVGAVDENKKKGTGNIAEYLLAILLIPMCIALGLPGLIFLAVAVKQASVKRFGHTN